MPRGNAMPRSSFFVCAALALSVTSGTDSPEEDELEFTLALPDSDRSWDSPLAQAADGQWESYVEENHLKESLTDEELEAYKVRYMNSARSQARSMDLSGSEEDNARQHRRWEKSLDVSLSQELPAVTKKMVEKVQADSKGWEAHLPEGSVDFSVKDASVLMGYVHEPEIENTTLDHFPEHIRRLASFPANFDTRDRWSQCAEVIGHVRDQGKCGSCWAMATAGSMDGRLCIATNGQFSGPDAWISAGYIASCYNMVIINGCQGGNPGWALSRAKQSFLPFLGGVPTGNEEDNTCVPYFGSGDALAHFDGKNIQAPKCPTKCTDKDYPRSLSKDRFFTVGSVTTTSDISHAKRALMDAGPVPMAFSVFADFMAYKSGYYDRTTDKKMGGHATTLIGWEYHTGADYLVSTNSWGTKWGEQGSFKMKASCCEPQYFVAPVASSSKALPLPGSPASVQSSNSNGKTNHRRRFFAIHGFRAMDVHAMEMPEQYRRSRRPKWHPMDEDDTNFMMPAPDSDNSLYGFNVNDGSNYAEQVVLRERVVLEIANLSCESSTHSDRDALENAVAMAVIGKFDRLIPGAVIEDLSGQTDHVTVVPCSQSLGCEAQSEAANTTSVAFYVVLPLFENASRVRQVAQADKTFLSDIEWRVQQALDHDDEATPVNNHPEASWQCFGNAKPMEMESLPMFNAHGFSYWGVCLLALLLVSLCFVLSAVVITFRRTKARSVKRKVALDDDAMELNTASPSCDVETQRLIAPTSPPVMHADVAPITHSALSHPVLVPVPNYGHAHALQQWRVSPLPQYQALSVAPHGQTLARPTLR